MSVVQLSLFPDIVKPKIVSKPFLSKYKIINNNYFGFELFEEILQTINECENQYQNQMFKKGIESAEEAILQLREEYYNIICDQIINHE